MPRHLLVAIAVLLCATACGGDNQGSTTPSTAASRTTETLASNLPGRVSRKFTVATAGVVYVTLTSVGPPSVPIGVGLGIPSGSACILSVAIVTEATGAPQVSASVDPGSYCAQVYNVGDVGKSLDFSVTIDHP
jgi:hypothetical protein